MGSGGGIFNGCAGSTCPSPLVSVVILNNSSIHHNNGVGGGGGLFNWLGNSMSVNSQTIVYANTANIGGGITNMGTMGITYSTISGNTASIWGGGISNASDGQGKLTINNARIINNIAYDDPYGSAIFNDWQATVEMHGSCISGNGIGLDFHTNIDAVQDATGNWWGASNGPSGAGPGSGESVAPNVDFSGFLTSPPAICNS